MFEDIRIEVSGEELREAALATINRLDSGVQTLDAETLGRVEVLSRKANKGYRYELTLDEAELLAI